MLKLVALSDTHNFHRKIKVPECDILIHTGDATGLGSKKEIIDFATWFENQSATHKIFSPGNHEKHFESFLPDSMLWFTENCPSGKLLIHEYIEIEGLKCFFSPYTPEFFNWAFMKKRGEEIKKYWESIPSGLDILCTHGMPYQILDTVIDWNTNKMIPVGCMDLRVELERIKPKIFIGGHLHMDGGTNIKMGETTYYNAAICDDAYDPTNEITVIDIDI